MQLKGKVMSNTILLNTVTDHPDLHEIIKLSFGVINDVESDKSLCKNIETRFRVQDILGKMAEFAVKNDSMINDANLEMASRFIKEECIDIKLYDEKAQLMLVEKLKTWPPTLKSIVIIINLVRQIIRAKIDITNNILVSERETMHNFEFDYSFEYDFEKNPGFFTDFYKRAGYENVNDYVAEYQQRRQQCQKGWLAFFAVYGKAVCNS